ncbi:MAG: pyruvate kinase [Gammaproteobacteria bacterium]
MNTDHGELPADNADLESLATELLAIRTEMVASAARARALCSTVHPDHQDSARNLLHYLALRRRDLRALQLRLAKMGLSSLGRAESNVLASVDAVLHIVHRLLGRAWHPDPADTAAIDFDRGAAHLAAHATALLGPSMPERPVRIMVTMPSEAAGDGRLVHALLEQGMDCMRINCAHDNVTAWKRMIDHLREAERKLGRNCRVFMDLGGPKLRTGPLTPGPAVVRVHPVRDACGRVTAPARIWFTASETPQPAPSPAGASLPVAADWLARLRAGDRVTFTDARDAHRACSVVEVNSHGVWAEATETAYLVPGIALQHAPADDVVAASETPVGPLPPRDSALTLQKGDLLVLTRDRQPGHPATHDSAGNLLTPATIGCTLPEAFDHARPGEPIGFDDGKIGGVIERVDAAQVHVRITQDAIRPLKLRPDKGINLPDTELRIAALTPKDIEDLPFIAAHADIVGLSFANSAADVLALQQHLADLGSRKPAIVLKVETRRGFEALPEMLLAALRAAQCGVMIARGDLAVECGFERLAEVQEEILWLCEAAHVPVIWATQVLETLAREGRPSRAEISDAAMGLRAECVMLNKGPYIVHAVRTLDDILRRMHAHQAKKRAMLRALRLADRPPADAPGA